MAFSLRAGTNWCHDFPKLARESGFHFNMHRRRVRVDWNRISSIDIDRVIGERDFSTIDENVNNVVDYCLESEYDVKILDPNFVKLFRLAQLAVEYLLYCKQYLDHSVVILKDELKTKLEENVKLKNELATREKTIKELRDKLKERTKSIEAKLSDSHGEIHKCPACPKTFVSAAFLSAHLNRRHPNASETNSPAHELYRAETEKLHSEIKTLKERLNLTERVIRNESDKFFSSESVPSNDNRDTKNAEKNYNNSRVNHRERDDTLEEQHRRYQEEIGHLKATLFDEIRSLKFAERLTREKSDNESCNSASVKELIREQENEITRLRQQLAAKRTLETEKAETRRDETREVLWQSKIENLEARYRADMEALYNQLRVTQQSAQQMRIDYTRRMSELERREASLETSLIRERGDERARPRSAATRDDASRLEITDSNGPETKIFRVPDPTAFRTRRFTGQEARLGIETPNHDMNFTESQSIPDPPKVSGNRIHERDSPSDEMPSPAESMEKFARTDRARNYEEDESTSRIPEVQGRRNIGEPSREERLPEDLRNGKVKIRVVSSRRDSGKKERTRHDESRETSSNCDYGPIAKKSKAHADAWTRSRNTRRSERDCGNHCNASDDKLFNGRKERGDKSSNPRLSGEKSYNRYGPIGEKSLNRREESGRKSAGLREFREPSANKTRTMKIEVEHRRTRVDVEPRAEMVHRPDSISVGYPREKPNETNISIERDRAAGVRGSATESVKRDKMASFSSEEEEKEASDSSSLESGSLSESSRTDEDKEPPEGRASNDLSRNDRSRREAKTSRYEDQLDRFNAKLREFGVDPEWRGIPDATFAQILGIIRHHRNINSKKYRKFEDTRRKLLHELSRRLAGREKERKNNDTNERSQLGRLVTNVKSRVSKALTILEKNDGCHASRPFSAINNKAARRENEASEKLSSNPSDCPSSDDSYRANRTTRANERYVDSPGKNLVEEASTSEFKQLSHSYESIKDFIKDTNSRQSRNTFNVSGCLVSSTPHRKPRIPMGDTISLNNTASPELPSPTIRTMRRSDLPKQDLPNHDSPINNSKSVLKSAIGGSVGNLAKKKVLFDLESPERITTNDEKSMYPMDEEPANDDRGDIGESDLDISSIRDERDEVNEAKDDSIRSSKIVVLKTSQSEKIAQISQQIEKQLSIARRKPAGSVEAMFLEKLDVRNDKGDSPVNVYPNFASPPKSRLEDSTEMTLPPSRDAPTRLDGDARFSNTPRKHENEITNLDMDIDELLRLE